MEKGYQVKYNQENGECALMLGLHMVKEFFCFEELLKYCNQEGIVLTVGDFIKNGIKNY